GLCSPLVALATVRVYALSEMPGLTLMSFVLGTSYYAGARVALPVLLETLGVWLLLGAHPADHVSREGVVTAVAVTAAAALWISNTLGRERRARTLADLSERRFHRVFEASQIGLIVIDAVRRRIVSVNPAFCTISGREEGELLGREPKDLMEGRTSPIIETPLLPQLMSGQLEAVRTSGVMLRPSGEHVHVDIAATVVESGDGASQLVGTVEDRTATVQA